MQKRAGFTLVEMLVATTLTLFTMAIITQAFVTSLEVFSQLKGIGDMEAGLRGASTIIRSDLSHDHFEGKRRMSDANFWDSPVLVPFSTSAPAASAVSAGFFHIRHGAASGLEGVDADGIPVYSAADHVLHFTIKLRGNRPENFLAAAIPGTSPLTASSVNYFDQARDGTYGTTPGYVTSQWGEVAYYLVPKGTTVTPTDPKSGYGTTLYALYRYQGVVLPRTDEINVNAKIPATSFADYTRVSSLSNAANGELRFSNPQELPHPAARAVSTSGVGNGITFPVFRGTAYAPDGTAALDASAKGGYSLGSSGFTPGAALVLSNVVSFNVRVLRAGDPDFTDVDNGAFDTAWDPADSGPPGYRIIALQITLRVWDSKTRQARQITIVQDM
jgi:hypothetical protein